MTGDTSVYDGSPEGHYESLLESIEKGSDDLESYVKANLRCKRLQELRQLASKLDIEFGPLHSKSELVDLLYGEGVYPGKVGDSRWYRRKGGHVK